MASFLVCLRRFAFFLLMGIQSFSLASYPATYGDKDGFYALVLLYLLPLGLWLFIMCKDDNLQWLFVVWLLYTIVFVIFIGVIFGGDEPLENKLNLLKGPKAQSPKKAPNASAGHASHSYATYSDCLFLVSKVQ